MMTSKNELNKENSMQLREIVYFDSDKAVSLISQSQLGVLKEVTTQKNETHGQKSNLGLTLASLFSGGLSREKTKSNATVERKEIFHDLLVRVENVLREKQLIADFSELVLPDDTTVDGIRTLLGEKPFIKSKGHCFIEDFSRIDRFSKILNKQIDFINRSNISNDPNNEIFTKLSNEIKKIERNLERTRNPNDRFVKEIELRDKYDEISSFTNLEKVDQWKLDGISYWIDTYLKDRLIFRIIPFVGCPSFQIICNLKRISITDKDIDYLITSYGTKPNLPFSVLGLITSKPSNQKSNFNPLDEFAGDVEMDKIKTFEKALRNMFPALEGMESFTRFSRYPNITVEPIAIFRDF